MKTLSFGIQYDILKIERVAHMKKIIFQDIDGVLYPCIDRSRLKMNGDRIKAKLIAMDAYYEDANVRDLLASYEGFDKEAMIRLKKLVDESGAVIVISSSWRFMHSLKDFKQMFHIHGLKDAVIDILPMSSSFLKEPAIQDYLDTHKDITSYVILDDINMESHFPNHCVVCPDVFDEECLQKAMEILK